MTVGLVSGGMQSMPPMVCVSPHPVKDATPKGNTLDQSTRAPLGEMVVVRVQGGLNQGGLAR
jgi:hypothetical protein